MASSGGASLLLCALFFLSTARAAGSCPPISQFSCKVNTLDFKGLKPCGNNHFRCGNSTMDHTSRNFTTEIQFGGMGQWYRVVRAGPVFHGNGLEIEDPFLSSAFTPTDCDFLYSFPSPGPSFIPPQTSAISLTNLHISCRTESDYTVLFSELIKRHQQPGPCTGYDLYSTSKEVLDSQNALLPPICLPGPDHPVFIWHLWMNNSSDGAFNVVSAGFSRRHQLFRSCFNEQKINTCGIGHSQVARRRKIILGISTGTGGFLLTCIMLCWWLHKKRGNLSPVLIMKSKNSQNIEAFLKQYGTNIPKRYGYAEVKKITKSFTESLGQGGYGAVFKGKLLDGRLVAVKVFKSKENAEEFINEVASIGRTHHINVVRLLGFCCERSKRALLYEFMPNGSLEKFIFLRKPENVIHLGWEKLLEIAIGIARGLEYLHRGCNTRIVHFDIKPHNILLDEDFCPKISDFGLAKSCRPKESILSTVGARGTIGYIAPEVFSRNFGAISSKSDVYSYGMMVLEMVGGRASIDVKANTTGDSYFPHWIYDHFNDSLALQLPDITNQTEEVARKMILVGLWCIQTSPSSRPSISKAVEMLEGSFEDIEMPPKPYLCSP